MIEFHSHLSQIILSYLRNGKLYDSCEEVSKEEINDEALFFGLDLGVELGLDLEYKDVILLYHKSLRSWVDGSKPDPYCSSNPKMFVNYVILIANR